VFILRNSILSIESGHFCQLEWSVRGEIIVWPYVRNTCLIKRGNFVSFSISYSLTPPKPCWYKWNHCFLQRIFLTVRNWRKKGNHYAVGNILKFSVLILQASLYIFLTASFSSSSDFDSQHNILRWMYTSHTHTHTHTHTYTYTPSLHTKQPVFLKRILNV
jgi:hypothetical protein